MEGAGSLPLASLSLHAFAPQGPATARVPKANKVATPGVNALREGPRSHPIAVQVVDSAQARSLGPTEATSSRRHAVGRLVQAVPAALARLVSGPTPQSLFTSPGSLTDIRVFPSAVPRRAPGGRGGRPGAGGGRSASLVWFRSDLRLHDNPVLAAAAKDSTSVLPVFVFDPRDYKQGKGGFARTGPSRAQFLLDSVADLRSRLRAAGSDLVVRVGRPEAVLPELAASVGAGAVYCQGEVMAEEEAVEGRVRTALERRGGGAELKRMWGGTLFHLEDLPFRLDAMPTTYADFRARVSKLSVRPLAESEQGIKGLPVGRVEPGELPTLQQLGLSAPPRPAPRAAGAGPAPAELRGGETEALRHLHAFIAELKASMAKQGAARPGASAGSSSGSSSSSSFSCRISPWLAMGCLSPRRMYVELQQQLGAAGAQLLRGGPQGGAAAAPAVNGNGNSNGPNANWLVFELLWRDFFRFVTKKYTMAAANGKAAAGRKAAAAAPAMAPALALA